MFDRRTKNAEIFKDTMEWIKNDAGLYNAVKNSISKQKIYPEAKEIVIETSGNRNCQTIISTKRSFEAAKSYAKEGKKVCVLNFASATNPGGGVKNGSSAQEEALCRCSTLYPCLDIKSNWKDFYLPHREARNPLYNDDIIYIPEVLVVKSDVSFPEKLPESDWYKVDVVTCAAPNLRSVPSNWMNPMAGNKAANVTADDLYVLLKKRIDRIFRAAIANGASALVLGAFGCGAFCNPPKVVAKAFYDVQKNYEKYLDVVEYAIYCTERERTNYETFCEQIK